jgi:hypothetical protein
VSVLLRAREDHSGVLLMAGRLEEAAAVALDGIRQARRLGLVRRRAAELFANATDALAALGRWDQADRVSREGLEAVPSDVVSVALPLARSALEVGLGELDAAEVRLRTVQRLLPALVHEAQRSGPLFCWLAELALWRGDLERARELVAEAVPLVAANPYHAAPLCALGLRIQADQAELARARHPGEPAGEDGTAPGCWSGWRRPPPARPPPGSRSWPPGTPSGSPSGPVTTAGLTRPPGQRRRPPGSGSANPTGPPTPATARPRR